MSDTSERELAFRDVEPQSDGAFGWPAPESLREPPPAPPFSWPPSSDPGVGGVPPPARSRDRPSAEARAIAVDWIVTIVGAVAIVLGDQGLGRQPVPDPVLVDGADPALRAARARVRGALLRPRARQPLRLPLPQPEAGEVIVFNTPPAAKAKCGAGGTFVSASSGSRGRPCRCGPKRPRTSTSTGGGSTSRTSRRADATSGPRRPTGSRRRLLRDGRQPLSVVRLARVGAGAAGERHRQGLHDLLAASADYFSNSTRSASADPYANVKDIFDDNHSLHSFRGGTILPASVRPPLR